MLLAQDLFTKHYKTYRIVKLIYLSKSFKIIFYYGDSTLRSCMFLQQVLDEELNVKS